MARTRITKAPTVTRITDNVTTNGTTITVAGTYTTPTGCVRLRVRMAGGGGGGASSGSSGNSGQDGSPTTFGSSLLTANGGIHGNLANRGGTGGTAIINSPGIGTTFVGGNGSAGAVNNFSGAGGGGAGGSSIFGGAGGGGYLSVTTATAAADNSGSGGGGGGNGSTSLGASGGGAGGAIDAFIINPSSSYSYSIGAGGAGGTPAGAGGTVGGAGGSGVIIIEEFYY